MKRLLIILFFFTAGSIRIFAQAEFKKEITLHESAWYDLKLPSETPLPIVNVSLSFNNKAFLIKASVRDNHFKDGNRSWRYGDGFFINFVTPNKTDSSSSDRFYAFGFSLQNKKPISVLVNKDGTYFPGLPPPPPAINVDTINMTADYTVTIPWKNLYPFHPFKKMPAGINIIYISQNDDRSRIIQKLIDDNYDTEMTNQRRFVPIKFRFSNKNTFFMTGQLKERLIDGKSFSAAVWVRSPKKFKARFSMSFFSGDSIIIKRNFIKRLNVGINKFKYSSRLPKQVGDYRLTININDTLIWSDNLLKYKRYALEQSQELIRLLTDSTSNDVVRFGGDVITYQIESLLKQIDGFNERKDFGPIKNSFEILDSLLEQYTNDKTVLNKSGYLLAAFKSSIDSTLQPFSLILPENFNIGNKYNLIIGLHGSGVNEISFSKYTAKIFGDRNTIIVAPRGRDLSSWYVGDTEKDIVELIRRVKRLFLVNKTILCGFSMGGYGVWRFGLLYPELFDFGIVISGIPFNLREEKSEYDLNNFINNKTRIPFLIAHGTDDHSLDIKYTDSFVEKLKKAGYDIQYVKIPGGGHGNFNSYEFILDWLNTKILLNN